MNIFHIILLLGAASATAVGGSAYGHGLGGDVAPPIDFGGSNVTVSTQLDPADLTVGDINTANIAVRFYDSDDNSTFNSVTYLLEVHRSGDLLARNHFFDDDGVLNIEVRPVLDCAEPKLHQCSQYGGSEHVSSPGALYAYGNGRPTITGPIFDKGGLYNVKVEIVGATSPRTLVDNSAGLIYDTFVSVAQEQPFTLQTANAEVPMVIKTYYDEVYNVDYDTADDSLSFEMPFDWAPEYIDLVAQVHEELQFPKSFAPYGEGKQFKGYVDGVEVEQRVLLLDPYSIEDKNIVHFLVSGAELARINEVLGEEHLQSKTMKFELVPQEGVAKNTVGFFLVDPDTLAETGTTINVAWDSRFGAGDAIPFEITFFDETRELLKDVRYAYYLVDESNNDIMLEGGTDPGNPDGLGILSIEGIDHQTIRLPSGGPYRLDIQVLGTGISYDPKYAGIGSALIEVGPGGAMPAPAAPAAPAATAPAVPASDAEVSIPSWVKSSAKFWADGDVDDASFLAGIEFMIKEGIISLPAGAQQQEGGDGAIPGWFRTSAGWWADGDTSDEEFASGLQYLITNGIISVRI